MNSKVLQLYSLDKKIALVTGAAQGMGAAISKQLAELGATVILTDINEAAVRETSESFAAEGLSTDYLKIDITDTSNIQTAADYLKKNYGRLDILVNNAGAANDKLALEHDDNDWRKMMAVNLDGTFFYVA